MKGNKILFTLLGVSCFCLAGCSKNSAFAGKIKEKIFYKEENGQGVATAKATFTYNEDASLDVRNDYGIMHNQWILETSEKCEYNEAGSLLKDTTTYYEDDGKTANHASIYAFTYDDEGYLIEMASQYQKGDGEVETLTISYTDYNYIDKHLVSRTYDHVYYYDYEYEDTVIYLDNYIEYFYNDDDQIISKLYENTDYLRGEPDYSEPRKIETVYTYDSDKRLSSEVKTAYYQGNEAVPLEKVEYEYTDGLISVTNEFIYLDDEERFTISKSKEYLYDAKSNLVGINVYAASYVGFDDLELIQKTTNWYDERGNLIQKNILSQGFELETYSTTYYYNDYGEIKETQKYSFDEYGQIQHTYMLAKFYK